MRKSLLVMRLLRDQDGGPLVEATIMIPILFAFLMGSIDFLYAFGQWNQASKAVEAGARIAAVSDPVADGLTGTNNIAVQALSATVLLGSAMPDFQVTCDGSASQCTCTRGTCTGMGSYSAAAMNLIVYGRQSTGTTCGGATNYYAAGMCNFLPGITASNVTIVYSQTGLGYAGRAAGPVPTITLSLQNVPFQFFFLSSLQGFTNINIPALTTTITGEALSSAAAN
jgi:Flp pilus assembly protein TadG